MRRLRAALVRLHGMLKPQRAENDFNAELESHIDLHTEDGVRAGLTPAEARRQALIRLGGAEQTRQAYRERTTLPWLENLVQDLRYGLRTLRKTPGFTLTAVLTLALGVGACTAMYSVVYAVILKPLPFAQPSRLLALGVRPREWLSLPTVEDWQRGSRAFASIAAYGGWSPKIESGPGAAHANALLVSQNLLGTLGAPLALGHDFRQSGNEADCFSQAIVTASYWKEMGGGATLSSRTLDLDYRTYAIVGVLAPSVTLEEMDIFDQVSILTPIGCDPGKSPESRGDSAFRAIGRMRDGVTLREATTELETKQRNLTKAYPNYYPQAFQPTIAPLANAVNGIKTRSALFATLAACGMLLLLACANLTNLLLARNMRRRGEFAIRATLGARPRHLAGQILAESVTLSIVGTAIGLLIAALLVRTLSHVAAVYLSRLALTRLNLPALVFAGSITILNAVLLTLLPATRRLRNALLPDLTFGGSRSSSASFGLRRAGRILAAAQLAIAFVLVASAGWTISSVYILLHQPLGFEPDHLLIASSDLRGQARNATMAPAKILATLDQALTDARAVPGVAEVAAANDRPLGGRVNQYDFCADIHPEECQHPAAMVPDVFLVTPGYFRTVGQDLYRGRTFTRGDDGKNHVAIVNRALAEEQWPGQNPIGHRVYSGDLHAWAIVVGEVGDVRSYSLERVPAPNLYLPETDRPDTSMTIFARTKGDPGPMDDAMLQALRRDNQIQVRYVESMPELMGHQVAMRQFAMWVIAAFGGFALVLAIVGTYALLAYEVSIREREIGIRLALGSSRSGIVTLLVRQESPWVGAGMLLGFCSAVLVGLSLRSEFYHAKSASVPVLLSSFVLLAIPVLASVAIPGRRASRLDPGLTLRQE